MGASAAEHAMAQTLDQSLQIERDESLVFDDEDIGCDLGRELATRLLHEFAQGRSIDIEHLGGIVLGQSFKRDQQERLARFGRDLCEVTLDRLTEAAP